MNCCIYRSKKKQGSYLYITEKNNFDQVPDELMKLFGKPEFSFEFELDENRKLANADAKEVIKHLQENGFFLQLPPPDDVIKNSSIA